VGCDIIAARWAVRVRVRVRVRVGVQTLFEIRGHRTKTAGSSLGGGPEVPRPAARIKWAAAAVGHDASRLRGDVGTVVAAVVSDDDVVAEEDAAADAGLRWV
jgi:hypothetical protein